MARALGAHTLLIEAGEPPSRALIGGKAWSLARMSGMGLSVPPAFVVTTEACRVYLRSGAVPDGLVDELKAGIAALEAATGRRFGTGPRALLVSVRSGGAVSMPGMMDTVLNLGMTETTEAALATESGDAGFARDSHRRFLEMYARIVLKAPLIELDHGADVASWRAAIASQGVGEVPHEAPAQLDAAVKAVFESWNSRRARRYREHHNLPHEAGTAVTVQAMIFGNMSDDSGTGVLFSRNPLTGDPVPYGEYLPRAQGEDVVSGTRTPEPLSALAGVLPTVHDELLCAARRLEDEERDVQDIEFTVERGRLYLLQARAAKRAPEAAVALAVDFVKEGRIDQAIALGRVSADQVRSLLRPRLKPGEAARVMILARGEGACPGVGVGAVVGDADAAEAAARAGKAVVLVRPTTSPEDVHGMIAAKAVVTAEGGSTSHAAVVSRALGLPCVVGCGAAAIAALNGRTVTVDGGVGQVFDGALAVVAPSERDDPRLIELARWATSASTLKVYARGEAPASARIADLDQLDGGEDATRLASLVAGCDGARGHVLASDAGVAAALKAGLKFIEISPVLPALLAAIAASRSAAAIEEPVA
ncbi:MAG: pyruvate, phosphate dikinase [Alphaproteobacteria bacterium]|nr:pyruvate, phosphate dikinase [Alphaproteobacteria bacterium]